MHALTDQGSKKVLLNLGDVTYIDSSGIGELVSGYTTMTNAGGTLKLLNLTKRAKDLLQVITTPRASRRSSECPVLLTRPASTIWLTRGPRSPTGGRNTTAVHTTPPRYVFEN
jgi:hypothetical protein